MNQIKSPVLLATLTALLLWAGQSLGGQTGLVFALVIEDRVASPGGDGYPRNGIGLLKPSQREEMKHYAQF